MRRHSIISEAGGIEIAMVLPLFLILAWSSFWIFDLLDQEARSQHSAWTYSILRSLHYSEETSLEAAQVNLASGDRLRSFSVDDTDRDIFDWALRALPIAYWRYWTREVELPDTVSGLMLLNPHSSYTMKIRENSILDLKGFHTDLSDVELDEKSLLDPKVRKYRVRVAGSDFSESGALKHLLWLEMTRDTDYPCLHPWGWGVVDILEIAGKSFGLPLDRWRKMADKALEYACPY